MGTANLTLSSLATEFVIIPVNATVAGVSHNPTSDTVQMAFLSTPNSVPQLSDWKTASWDTTASFLYPYLAQCLVGPTGTVTLTAGTYTIWIKIADSPETPVQQVGSLTIV